MAKEIGLKETIILQTLKDAIKSNLSCQTLEDGKIYVPGSYAEFRNKYFPYWSEATIRRKLNRLHELGYIESCQPEGFAHRRKYYTVIK